MHSKIRLLIQDLSGGIERTEIEYNKQLQRILEGSELYKEMKSKAGQKGTESMYMWSRWKTGCNSWT